MKRFTITARADYSAFTITRAELEAAARDRRVADHHERWVARAIGVTDEGPERCLSICPACLRARAPGWLARWLFEPRPDEPARDRHTGTGSES